VGIPEEGKEPGAESNKTTEGPRDSEKVAGEMAPKSDQSMREVSSAGKRLSAVPITIGKGKNNRAAQQGLG